MITILISGEFYFETSQSGWQGGDSNYQFVDIGLDDNDISTPYDTFYS